MIFLSSFQRERETSSRRKRLEENYLHGFLALPNRSLLTRPLDTLSKTLLAFLGQLVSLIKHATRVNRFAWLWYLEKEEEEEEEEDGDTLRDRLPILILAV